MQLQTSKSAIILVVFMPLIHHGPRVARQRGNGVGDTTQAIQWHLSLRYWYWWYDTSDPVTPVVEVLVLVIRHKRSSDTCRWRSARWILDHCLFSTLFAASRVLLITGVTSSNKAPYSFCNGTVSFLEARWILDHACTVPYSQPLESYRQIRLHTLSAHARQRNLIDAKV